jgi:hypothetical protein
MLDARQTALDTLIVRLILEDMDQEWPWPEYPGLRRPDISLCIATGTLGPLVGTDGILAKAFIDSLETCVPEVEVGDWEYVQNYVRHVHGDTYSNDDLRAGIERLLTAASLRAGGQTGVGRSHGAEEGPRPF